MRSPLSLTPKRAVKLFGKNFFGVEEAIRHFGVRPTRNQLVELSEIPFSEVQCKDDVLMAVFPLSILDLRDKLEDQMLFCDDWYDHQPFAKERCETSWQLVRKTPIVNSACKTWQEQQSLLSNDEEVPTAQVMVHIIIGHYLATSERLFEYLYVRTSSIDSDGRRVYIGHFNAEGLHLGRYWDNDRRDDLAISSARKFNLTKVHLN